MKLRYIALATIALFAVGPVATHAGDELKFLGFPPVLNLLPTSQGASNAEGGHVFYNTSHTLSIQALYPSVAWEGMAVDGNPILINGQSQGPVRIASNLLVGSSGSPTLSNGELALAKISASGTAPTAGFGKLALVSGTTAGTCKLVAYAGTSTTPSTVLDNIGSGC